MKPHMDHLAQHGVRIFDPSCLVMCLQKYDSLHHDDRAYNAIVHEVAERCNRRGRRVGRQDSTLRRLRWTGKKPLRSFTGASRHIHLRHAVGNLVLGRDCRLPSTSWRSWRGVGKEQVASELFSLAGLLDLRAW